MKAQNVAFLNFVLLVCALTALPQERPPLEEGNASVAAGTNTNTLHAKENLDQDLYGLELFPKRGGQRDWGLALSGGGVRAAAFSIGAMKVLYDEGILDEIDVISSVSGGGYASYWLFTNYYENRSQKFGEVAFRNDQFIKNVCELQNLRRSNFVRDKQYLRVLVKGDEGFEDYEEAIKKSFGPHPPSDQKIDFLKDEITAEHAPYFIINATLNLSNDDKRKNRKLKQDSSEVFELTPHFRGNPAIRFRDWTTDTGSTVTISKSIAMSGAPKFFNRIGIRGKIQNFHTSTVKGKNLYLRDGGFSENLGALALIRRGIPNIIIVDSEADPRYKFDAYLTLQKMLKEDLQIEFCVPNIERFLKSGKACESSNTNDSVKKTKAFSVSVSIGHASRKIHGRTPINSDIYYVKMSLPESVLPDYFFNVGADTKKQARISNGEKIDAARQCERCPATPEHITSDDVRKKCPESCRCNCQDITLNHRIDDQTYDDLYAFRISEYSNYLNNPKKLGLWLKTKPLNALGSGCYFVAKPKFLSVLNDFCSLLSYTFPHTTTLDQSFFSDQFEAFVGLGYLQTKQLCIEIAKRGKLAESRICPNSPR